MKIGYRLDNRYQNDNLDLNKIKGHSYQKDNYEKKRGKNVKSITNYLDDLKEICGSDYATAKKLEIKKESVSMIRKRGQISDETAIKIAEVLKIEKSEMLIAAAIARSNGEVKTEWENLAKKAGLAASVIIALSININQEIYNKNSILDNNSLPIICIMRSLLEWILRAMSKLGTLNKGYYFYGQEKKQFLPYPMEKSRRERRTSGKDIRNNYRRSEDLRRDRRSSDGRKIAITVG